MPQTEMQIKMAKLRAKKGKPKGKKQAGGRGSCPHSKCSCGCGKKHMCGEGKRLQAVAKAAKVAAKAAKKAAAFALKHRKEIASGIGAAATIGQSLTGNKTLGTIGSIADVLGSGKQRGRGDGLPVVNGTTGELVSPSIYYPNSSSLFTGRLVF